MNKLDLFLSKTSLNEHNHSTSALGSVELYRFNTGIPSHEWESLVYPIFNGLNWILRDRTLGVKNVAIKMQ